MTQSTQSTANLHELIQQTSFQLLNHLNEDYFFSEIGKFFKLQSNSYRVLVFETIEDSKSARLRSVDGLLYDESLHGSFPESSLSNYVAKMKRGYFSNSRRDPLMRSSLHDENVHKELALPIICDDLVMGTIHIQVTDESADFKKADLKSYQDLLGEFDRPIKNLKIYLMAKHLNQKLQMQLESLGGQQGVLAKNSGFSQQAQVLPAHMRSSTELIGQSNAFIQSLRELKKLASEDFPMAIIGERGTGKKSMAIKAHEMSSRHAYNVEIFHCNVLDDGQTTAQLFGSESSPGALERCHGGTIVLDQIEDLGPETQKQLLRYMLTGLIYPSGLKMGKSVNVRLICTNKRPLTDAFEEGKIIEDLLYRIGMMTLKLSSLRDRPEDIKVLSEHFLNKGANSSAKMITTGALEKLLNYSWIGNIQELRALMERVSILCEDSYIKAEHLPELEAKKVEEVIEDEQPRIDVTMTLDELEKLHITNTLEALGGNKTKAAKSLGVTVKTLYNKLHRYGLIQ